MFSSHDAGRRTGLPLYQTVVGLACVLILMVNGWSLYHNLGSLKAANDLQTESAQVNDKLQYLNVLVMDAESSLRGYFLSGSEVYLGPMRTLTSELDGRLRELDALVEDNPSQRKNLAQLRTLIYRKIDNLNQTMNVYRQGGLKDIVDISANTDGKTMLDEIRLQVVIMVKEQNELLGKRAGLFYNEYENAVFLGITINVMAIVVLALFYRLIRRSYFARLAAQRELEHANENLESMVVVRTEQLAVLSRHLIRVSEEEKARLARELHDELGANLTSINFDLGALAQRLAKEPDMCDVVERARRTLVDTMALKRRLVENLRPSLLDNLGLSAALQSYGEEFSQVAGLDCEVLIEGDIDEASPTHAIAVFRIVQEALNNIAKYAQARNVIVNIAAEGELLSLEVSDDGIGIDNEAFNKPKSHGLLGMRERALLLGGSLKVHRGVNGVGTCVEALIPLKAPAPQPDAVAAASATVADGLAERLVMPAHGLEGGRQKPAAGECAASAVLASTAGLSGPGSGGAGSAELKTVTPELAEALHAEASADKALPGPAARGGPAGRPR
jgi:signal transduction histidine kinase